MRDVDFAEVDRARSDPLPGSDIQGYVRDIANKYDLPNGNRRSYAYEIMLNCPTFSFSTATNIPVVEVDKYYSDEAYGS